MSLFSPAEGWFYKKVSKDEKMWMVIALMLCLMLFVWMIMWHVYGKQNPSNITYRTSTSEFSKLSEAYTKQNMIGADNGIPVVRPEPNSDVFVMSEMWRWSPVLILQMDQSYKLHISSKDVVHGFSIQPVNMNFQVYPGYDYVLEFKPTETGEYKVICNEFCGIGHHTMIGKIVVIEKDEDLKLYGYENLKKAPEPLPEKKNELLTEKEMALLGEQVYTLKGCGACHKTDGSSQFAPAWNGLFGKREKTIENGKEISVVVDEKYIRESIKNPQQKITVGFENTPMPVFPVTDEEIEQLVAYIKTLKKLTPKSESMFRTCDITGFKVDLQSQKLIRYNAVFAVISLLLAVIAALLLVFTRYQPVHLLGAEWYYRLVTFHGLNALIFWIIFFEIAGLYFASTVILNTRFCAPKLGWIAFFLMVAGLVMSNIIILMGKADVMLTSYTPLKAHPLYYLGVILFAVGALLGVILFFGNLMIARREKAYGDTLPLFVYGMMTAAIIAVITLASGALIYIPTFLWSLGLINNIDPGMYKLIWWGLGHSSQQINVAAMVSIWYLVSFLAVGGTSINERVSRTAFVLYILFICLASAHHLLTDPGVSSAWKVWNTSYAMYLAVLASMIHAFAVPSSFESAQRRWGYNKGLFQWLSKAPWGNPAFSSIILAVIGFGFIGGTTGVIFGMEQTNIIVHNTLAIPGHFKGTVVIGTTLTFMGITYYLIPLIFRRKIVGMGWARWQPWMFFAGIALLSVSMIVLGQMGVPRRHWDSTFSGGPFTYSFNPAVDFFWVLMMLGGTIAFLSTIIWIVIVVISVSFGPKVNGPEDMQLTISPLAPQAKAHKGFEAPGTLVLTMVFLLVFLALFFLNWKWLAATWNVN